MQKNPIQNLINRLQAESDSVVVVYENDNVDVFDVKYVYDLLLKATQLGTLVINGDYRLNQDVSIRRGNRNLSNQQRVVIASNKLLQLLLLEHDVNFVNHPGFVIGTKGKFSRFFSRKMDLDFPYGGTSVFNDIYDLNAIILFVGKPYLVDAMKLAGSKMESPIIRKNTSFIDGEMISYLDYHLDLSYMTDALLESNVLLNEQIGETYIYGIRYHDLIDFALSLK